MKTIPCFAAAAAFAVTAGIAFGAAETIYENDFATRRSSSAIAGTVSAPYPAHGSVSNTVGTVIYPQPADGATGDRLVPAKVAAPGVAEPAGADGWRMLLPNASATGEITMRRFNANSCLRFGYEGFSVGAAHPIGTTFRDGTLRMVLDMRLPGSFGTDADVLERMAVSLGDDTLYGGVRAACLAGRFCSVGVGFSSASSGVPHYLDAVGTAHTGAYSLKMSSWYRAEITVYLDADPKTFDYVLYEQLTGDPNGAPSMNAANGTQVFAVSGVEGMNGVSEISTLALFASRSAAFFDSIRIWHTPSAGSQETLVYKNSFSERTIWAKAAVLTGGDAPFDSWRMLRTDLSGAFAFGGNPALAFDGGDNSSGQAGHPLGTTLTSGEVVAQADIRAPRGWTANGGSAYVRLGGDGHLAAQDGYLTQVAAAFGFRCMADARANTWSGSLCTNSAIVAWNENASGGAGFVAAPATVTPGRWYRFVATARMRESLCEVAVYDMGEAQPTLATSTPASPMATFSDLPFRTPKAALGGISCISASATTVRPNLLDPSSMPWFDNFRVVLHAQTATVLSIR